DAQTRLRHTLLTFQSLIEASPLPIMSIDRDGVIEIWNHAAEELFGWRRDEVVGTQSPLVPPDLSDEWNAIRDEVFAGGVIRSRSCATGSCRNARRGWWRASLPARTGWRA